MWRERDGRLLGGGGKRERSGDPGVRPGCRGVLGVSHRDVRDGVGSPGEELSFQKT